MLNFVKGFVKVISIGLFTEVFLIAFCMWYNNTSFRFPEFMEYVVFGVIAIAAYGMSILVTKIWNMIEMIVLTKRMARND